MSSESAKILSALMKGLRKGCVCQISNEKFAEYIHQGLTTVHEYGEEQEDQNVKKRTLLSFLTFLRGFTKFTLLLTGHHETDDDILCKRLHSWLILMRKLKIYLLKGLLVLKSKLSDQNDFHLLHLSQDTFNYILTMFPCPLISQNPEEGCRKLCQPLLVKLEPPEMATLAKLACQEIESQVSKLKKGVQMNCESGVVHVSSPCDHYKYINGCLLQNLRSHWKLSWMNHLNSSTDLKFKSDILTLWKCLVDVKSNMTLLQMREFVSSAISLDSFKKEENSILKRKWLEVLNEILCYGSTLGIQSDVPGEVSEVAHQIVRLSRVDGIDFKVSEVHIGLAGDCIEPNSEEDDEKVPDLVTLQGLCLIHLKSVALLVREAQCCSSSDESDSSLSSRGSSSIAEEDREMKMIEKNVVELLIKLRFWINDILGLPSSNSLSSSIVTLFNEQDDGLIEALLCLLDTHSGLQYGSYSSRIGISCGQDDDDSMDFFDPIDAFEQFLSNIGNDSSVVLDFLLSNETCFLLYLLRMLKYLNKKTQHPSKNAILQTLSKVSVSIKKLTDKNLFPYDIKPVQRQLEKLLVSE